MMTIASSTRIVVKQALKWTVLAGAILVMGQATALGENSVSVLMKQPLADMTGKVATMLMVNYAPELRRIHTSIQVRCSPTSWRERWSLK